MSENVGLVGFGIMGTAIAARLTENNYSVLVYDISPAAISRAQGAGYITYETPADIAKRVGVVLMSLPKPEHVINVVRGSEHCLLASALKGLVIVDTSTVDTETSKKNAAEAAKQGVGYLDCPVLGRPATCGNWTLPTGGNLEYIEIARPVLETFAASIISVGPSGHGNIVKLLNNLMFGAINSITCEIFALCHHLDMKPDLLFDTISNSGAGTVSNLFKELGPKIINRDFSPVFSIDNMYKDVELGIAMSAQSGMTLKISEIGQQLNEAARVAGLGKEDTAAVVKVYENALESRRES